MTTKLPVKKFAFTADNGEKLAFDSVATVDSAGVFSLSIPDELEDALRAVLKNHKEMARFDGANIGMRRPRDRMYVSATTLQACERVIQLAADEFLLCEVITERIIAYSVDVKTTYMKDAKGNFYANGYDVGAQAAGATWVGTLNATTTSQSYSVGFGARVFDKTTHRRASGDKVTYVPADWDLYDEGYGARLSKFVALTLDPAKSKHMPYSEDAARFMYETMLGLCRLGDRVQAFFNDEPRLLLAIEQQTPLLTLAPTVDDA